MHPIDYLFEELKNCSPYPTGVVEVPSRLPGVAFFPGGSGLWGTIPDHPIPSMPVGGIMILGHNFYHLDGFKKLVELKTEVPVSQTWKHLCKLFDRVGIQKEQCFFTNAYMGLIDGPSPEGKFPGSKDPEFVKRCKEFLSTQIRVMKPRLILTLGNEVPPFIATLSPQLQSSWLDEKEKGKKIGDLDKENRAIVYPTFFRDVPHPICVSAITHPARYNLNVRNRDYKDLKGNEAEIAILKDALQIADL